MTREFKRKTNLYKETDGTINKLDSPNDKANQSRAEETDIKSIIAKYGVMPIEMLNIAKEPLYLDNRGTDLTLNERLKQRQQMDEYFEQLPAKVRKDFNDSKEEFYNALLTGDYSRFEENKILDQQQIQEHEAIRLQKQTQINNLTAKINTMEGEINDYKQQIENISKVSTGESINS